MRTAIETALHDAIPSLKSVFTPPAKTNGNDGDKGKKTIEYVLSGPAKPAITIPCELASDGALLVTAFLALAYGDTPDVVLIEEPENGLHPSRLKIVVDLLRKMTTGEVGNRPRQVILTTHSPLLLNFAKKEEIRILRRDPDLGTQVTPMSEAHEIDKLLGEFGVGELWYLLGEEGLLEGKKP